MLCYFIFVGITFIFVGIIISFILFLLVLLFFCWYYFYFLAFLVIITISALKDIFIFNPLYNLLHLYSAPPLTLYPFDTPHNLPITVFASPGVPILLFT